MSWSEKAPIKKLEEFCKKGKTRKEIKENFNMSDIESWHCVRHMQKLKHSFRVDKYAGPRPYIFTTRGCVFVK